MPDKIEINRRNQRMKTQKIYEDDFDYMLKIIESNARANGNVVTIIPANLGKRVYVHSPKVDIRNLSSKFRARLMVLRVWPRGVDEKLLKGGIK